MGGSCRSIIPSGLQAQKRHLERAACMFLAVLNEHSIVLFTVRR